MAGDGAAEMAEAATARHSPRGGRVQALAVATKRGAARAELSAERDAARYRKQVQQLEAEREELLGSVARQTDIQGKLELANLKLTKKLERELQELRSTTRALGERTSELAATKKSSAASLHAQQEKLRDMADRLGKMQQDRDTYKQKLQVETGALVAKAAAMNKVQRALSGAQQQLLLLRDTVARLEGELRDTSMQLRIERTEHARTSDQSTKRATEIKMLKSRFEAESLRAGQLMSALATAKNELAVCMEQHSSAGSITPGLVLENDQLKQERGGFVSQIRGLTDSHTKAQVETHNALRQLEREKSEHNRYAVLYKEKTEELRVAKRTMGSLRDAQSAALADRDLRVMELGATVKELTRAKDAAESELRARSVHHSNLLSEVAQLQKRGVGLRDANASLTSKLQTQGEELLREAKLRTRHEAELQSMAERLTRVKDQAGSDGRSAGNEREQLQRELALANGEVTRLSDQLRKEKKASGTLLLAKKAAESEGSKMLQKAQEHRERFEQTALELGEVQQRLREERTLRSGAEKSLHQCQVARDALQKELDGLGKAKRGQELELSKKKTALKTALAELAVYKEQRVSQLQNRGDKQHPQQPRSARAALSMPHPPKDPLLDSGPFSLATPNLDKAYRGRRAGQPKERSSRDDNIYSDYQSLLAFEKEIEVFSKPVDIPGLSLGSGRGRGQGTAASARLAARTTVTAAR